MVVKYYRVELFFMNGNNVSPLVCYPSLFNRILQGIMWQFKVGNFISGKLCYLF